ncbi:hypothetical protein JCM14036_35320 [Desulfotomaculum defluvii]
MEDKLSKELKEPAQKVNKGKAQVQAPTDCGEGPIYVARGSDG